MKRQYLATLVALICAVIGIGIYGAKEKNEPVGQEVSLCVVIEQPNKEILPDELTSSPSKLMSGLSCTNFMASFGGKVLFADSEDGAADHPMVRYPLTGSVWFLPGGDGLYGRMHIGWLWKGKHDSFQVGMNEKGLAYGCTAAPKTTMNRHPERPFKFGEDAYIDRLLFSCATVDEAVELTQKFDMESMWFQVMLGDSNGDAAILSPGSDGELAVTRKMKGNGYLVASTFNVADSNQYCGRDSFKRYSDAVEIMRQIDDADDFTVELFREGLDVVHRQNNPFSGAYTVYSDIFDLENKIAYIYFFSQFGEVVEFNLAEELAKGKQRLNMVDLFSQKTVDAGISELRAVMLKAKIRNGVVIAVVLVVILGLVALMLRKLVRRLRCRASLNESCRQ